MGAVQQLLHGVWTVTPWKDVVRPLARTVRDAMWAPWNWRNTSRSCRIFARDYGHLRSAARKSSVDANGEPIPWITYPAIEYLNRFDFSSKVVFEYGCGNSTRYWAKRAAQVVSVEHVADFYELIKRQLPANCELTLRSPAEVYVNSIETAKHTHTMGRGFDVIVIDGHSRVRCAQHAADHLVPGGLVILDNSDWFPEAAAHLRAAGLLEVSFSGFAPIVDCATATSFFFHREFAFPLSDRVQPIGGVPKPAFQRVP